MFAVVVVVLAYGCYLLGQWQFHRLHDREATNTQTRTNLRAEPAPVGDVLSEGRPSAERDEWRRVTATGTYVPDASVVVRYQTRDGASGVDVVTPLRTARGTALLVDRGWMATTNSGATPVDAAGAAGGHRHRRRLGPGRRDRRRHARHRPVHPGDLQRGDRQGRRPPVYGGFVDVEKESPRSADAAGARGAARPRQRAALLLRPAVVVLRAARGVRVLLPGLRRAQEAAAPGATPVRAQRSMPPSTGSITPVTKLAAGDSRNAAARPNSSGSP